MSNVPTLLRDINARSAVLRRLAEAHDRFADAEHLYLAEGQIAMAEGAHQYALIALRAWIAERDNPDPRTW